MGPASHLDAPSLLAGTAGAGQSLWGWLGGCLLVAPWSLSRTSEARGRLEAQARASLWPSPT